MTRRDYFQLLMPIAFILLLISAAGHAAGDQALTCRFRYKQTFTKADVSSPDPISLPIEAEEVYTFIFNRSTRKGTWIHEYGPLGTGSGSLVMLEEGVGRLSFYEGNVFGDNLFFLTVFTSEHEKLPDGRHPAVMSSHGWRAGEKNVKGEEEFLPTQRIGSCR